MFKSLLRCIRRLFSRIKPKHREDQLQRRTEYGADIDIEEALAEQLEIQRRSGRVLSSTASIAAALRQRPREDIPVFSTHLGNDEHRAPSDPAIKAAVEEMQSLTPGYIGQTGEKPESLVNGVVSKRVPSSRISSSRGSSFKAPSSVPEDGEPEVETETKDKENDKDKRDEWQHPLRAEASAGRLEQHHRRHQAGQEVERAARGEHGIMCVGFACAS
ncbi:hypothetical protein PR002_g16061 [Phytophthora rubi]|uniref:Uncharacterized protein n=1 Tax=Phytophthora rubi TaxID=129364 RepID=A0A6A3KKI8_9STRA|nr:hypothetical protein PR002_g16061 [Phytophthora rubi]